ncbi:hypothetical protein [Bhargavaea ullalensis]|uniref:Uncharacterized protein n=1 Tax=Bhargavaea ullalensis TaxID=1265685 RepID=A0ABV2GBV8_9BACL
MTIFSLTVPSSWIAVLIAMAAAYSIVRVRADKAAAGLFADAAFWFILVWKGSYILFHFGVFIRSPFSVLYYNGGTAGATLGLLSALFFLYRKKAADQDWLLTAAVSVQAVYQTAMVLLNRTGWLPGTVTIAGFLILLTAVLIKNESSAGWTLQLAVLFPVVHLFIAAMQPEGVGGFPVIATAAFSVYFILQNVLLSKAERGAHE